MRPFSFLPSLAARPSPLGERQRGARLCRGVPACHQHETVQREHSISGCYPGSPPPPAGSGRCPAGTPACVRGEGGMASTAGRAPALPWALPFLECTGGILAMLLHSQ